MFIKNMIICRSLGRKRHRLTSCILVLLFILYTVLNSNLLARPYYQIDYPEYTFISEPERPLVNICNPINGNYTEFKVVIDGQPYPQIIPLYYNQSINFTCLNLNPKRKRILLWNKFTGLPNIPVDGGDSRDLLLKSKCPVTNCDLTSDRSMANSSDMILFHMRSRIDEFPKVRFSSQKWVYVIYESQLHCPMCSKLDNLFNLSSTFSSTSDITSLYLSDSRLKWSTSNPDYNETNYLLSSKPGFAVILISDCGEYLNRLKIVKYLRQYIPVDIYGKCSDQGLKCPQVGDCRQYLAKRYKFFFSFENSFCKEYVTEKFFNTLNYDIVPVVLGAGEYTRFAPQSAFINLMNYATLNELADYLIQLSNNQTAYTQFFKWKQFIQVDRTERTIQHYCEMCISLQMEEFTGIKHKVFSNHSRLFKMRDNCQGIRIDSVFGTKFLKLDKDNVKMKYLESY